MPSIARVKKKKPKPVLKENKKKAPKKKRASKY